jgi:hypothetical protein
MIEKIVQTAKLAVKEIVLSQSAALAPDFVAPDGRDIAIAPVEFREAQRRPCASWCARSAMERLIQIKPNEKPKVRRSSFVAIELFPATELQIIKPRRPS